MKSTGGKSSFKVRSNEVDYQGNAMLPALVGYMQEAAWENTDDLGISMYELMEQGLTWVLQRLRVEMFKYPKHQDKITVSTWASGRERVFLYRDFRLFNSEGDLLGQATSVWLVMNVAKRQMVSVPDFIKAVETSPGQEPLPFAKGKLPQLNTASYKQEIPVRWHDIDMNQHVTNTRYLQWVLDVLPLEVLEKELRSIDIIFKAESLLGDTVLAEAGVGDKPEMFLHKLTNLKSDKELIQAVTTWE
jgi:medium-chain acyl-[acyl-carrier-protein] hydrolase